MTDERFEEMLRRLREEERERRNAALRERLSRRGRGGLAVLRPTCGLNMDERRAPQKIPVYAL